MPLNLTTIINTPLITVDNDEIISVGVSQEPGLMAPSINAKIMPNNALAQASWFQYDAPELTISIGGTSYTCLPQETSIEIDPESIGVDIEVQYYPETLVKLQNTGLRKNLVFLSAPQHQIDVLEGEYDEDEYEVLSKTCDVYTSNGWTVNQILKEIGSRAGVSVSTTLPTFHVPNPTVIFQRGQAFLPFMKSLLPSDFEYAWMLVNNKVSISLIEKDSSKDISFIDGMYRMVMSKSAVPAYNMCEIRGGDYLYGTHVSIGNGGGSSISYSNGKLVNETLDPEIVSTTDGDETHCVTRIYRTGPDGKMFFALTSRTTKIIGPYIKDGTTYTKTLRETTETFTYENDDVVVYEQPRQTQIDTATSLIYTKVAAIQVSSSTYQVSYLTDDSRVLTAAEYLALETQPTVLLSAYQTYGAVESKIETFSWTQTDDADKNWFEGTQKENTVTKTSLYCQVNGNYYDALMSPKELLQQVLADISTEQEILWVSSMTNDISRTSEITIKKVTLLNSGSFQSEQSRSIFDTKRKCMDSQHNTQSIDGSPPGQPSKYRTEQLKVTIESDGSTDGGIGGSSGATCIPFFGEINTNNPTDFETWAGMLWEQVSAEQRKVSMVSFDRLLPMGSSYGGVTMTSFQASQMEDGTQNVTMGGV